MAVVDEGGNLDQRNSDCCNRSDVDVDRRGGWWWVGGPRPVEADDRVALAEPGAQGRSDETARTRDEDDLRSTFVAPRPTAFAISHTFCPPSQASRVRDRQDHTISQFTPPLPPIARATRTHEPNRQSAWEWKRGPVLGDTGGA